MKKYISKAQKTNISRPVNVYVVTIRILSSSALAALVKKNVQYIKGITELKNAVYHSFNFYRKIR